MLTSSLLTWGHNNDEKVGSLLRHPHVMIGASDGGAHILSFFNLRRHRLFVQPVLSGITTRCRLKRQSRRSRQTTADIWAIADRGLLKSGYIADVDHFLMRI